ncbi:N-acetylmuramoyl-L-alanine amidase family protein [Clostridium beijerinckii]|uniref:N-acetylmuramoyl-L-alanine amidase family protein n=1 Tax=Clostridium beijerinckii TaxID=1520 RepID=UPI0022E165FD|nr:cadherin-like beta sandwich domain-containing protein [Clostridium beijerinckii]
MNRGIKYIISFSMVVSIFSTVEFSNTLSVMEKTVYASSYELTDLKLENTGGGDINLYENDNYTKELNNDKSLERTYYAKISSDRSKVVFDTSGFDGTIKIFKSNSKKIYNKGDEIPVLTGKTTFYIRLYDKYDEDKPTDCTKEYKVIVKRYTSEEENAIKSDNQDNIYLKNIQLDYGDIPINFDKEKSSYSVKVSKDVKSIPIKAEPEDGSIEVRINNIIVDENDDYKKTVNLDKGNNKIEIDLSQYDEEKRSYIVNIDREDSANVTDQNNANSSDNKSPITVTNGNGSNNSNDNENNITNTSAHNKWVKVSDKWRYNDSYGNPIRNSWYYDNTYGKKYYFDNEGNMVIGWLKLNNSWYYLDNSGAMEIGWKKVEGNWYYLDYDGKMKTGWFKDSDGRYYYLNESNGVMMHDTMIGRYKLGSDGSWIA